jgi:tetratricopeptide (TPR) repeat protein
MQQLRLFLFSFLLCLSSLGTAQETASLDSLERALKNKISNQDRFAMVERLFNHYKLTDYQKALGYANQSYSTALAMGDSNKIVLGGRQQAYVLMDLDKNKEALMILQRILAIAKRNSGRSFELKKQIKLILNNVGIVYNNLGYYDKALEYHFESLSIREGEGDRKSIAAALNNIGSIFYDIRDSNHAIEYLQRAVDVKKEVGDNSNLDRILINIGLCYNQLNQFKKGIEYFNKGLTVCIENCSDDIKKEGYLGLGIANLGVNDIIKAEEYFLKSLKISKKQRSTIYQIYNLHELSLVESARGNDKKALRYLLEALLLAEGSDFAQPLIQIYGEFAKIYSKTSDYKNTALYMGKYIKLKDSIHSTELSKNLTKVQTEYAERENQKTITSQKQILALNAQLITRQKQQTIFIAVIALLLLLLAGIFYKNYRDKLIANRRLDEKVKEHTEELRASHQNLDKSFNLQQLTMQQVWQEGQGILSSIKGLCHVAQLDLQETKGREYVSKVNDSTAQLATLLAKLK